MHRLHQDVQNYAFRIQVLLFPFLIHQRPITFDDVDHMHYKTMDVQAERSIVWLVQ